MENKLQELTDKLYKEGLSKGKEEGEAILAKANEKAAEIIEEAKKQAESILKKAGSLTHNFSHIITREASSLFFLSNLFSIFVVYISKYHRYETCN